jgi:UDPglucose 6-dehydrogenase
MRIGIIGNGFVGKTLTTFCCDDIRVVAYDINENLRFPDNNVSMTDLIDCEIVFISVPTPMNLDGSCHLDIITNVLTNLRELNYTGFIVLRSTVPVGTCDKLNVRFMPEFLTEKNALYDFKHNKEWYFGLLQENDEIFKEKITTLFNLAHQNNCIVFNNICFVTNKEGEMIKLFRNCFLSVKVSFCNELYDFCNSENINYETVQKLACSDERIQLSHTSVPGHDGLRGFGGTCFPKDTSSLLHQFKSHNVMSYIIKAAVERNNTVDRPQQDWKLDKGRTVI